MGIKIVVIRRDEIDKIRPIRLGVPSLFSRILRLGTVNHKIDTRPSNLAGLITKTSINERKVQISSF